MTLTQPTFGRVIDSAMGSYKSQTMIKSLNDVTYPVIVICELGTEIDRYATGVDHLVHVTKEAEAKGITCLEVLEDCLKDGLSVVTSHTLLQKWPRIFSQYITMHGYHLAMDEVLNGIFCPVSISNDDLQTFLDEGRIKTVPKEENPYGLVYTDKLNFSKYQDFVRIVDTKDTYVFNHGTDEDPSYQAISTPRKELFKSFKTITVCTYQYEGSILAAFFKLIGIPVMFQSVNEGKFVPYIDTTGESYKDKIHIYKGKHNQIGARGSLSKTWALGGSTPKETLRKDRAHKLKCSLRNIFLGWQKVYGCSKETFLYTWHIGDKGELRDDLHHGNYADKNSNADYIKSNDRAKYLNENQVTFLASNTRGTNLFSDKLFVAYLPNIHPQPFINNFLSKHGLAYNEEQFALSQMIQFLFRSGIRNAKDIHVFIPSTRMRHLLLKWLGYEDKYFF